MAAPPPAAFLEQLGGPAPRAARAAVCARGARDLYRARASAGSPAGWQVAPNPPDLPDALVARSLKPLCIRPPRTRSAGRPTNTFLGKSPGGMYTHNPTRSCVNATQYARARSKGTSTKRKDGFLAKNPPNEITPKTLTHAHFALLADGSPAGGSQAKGGSYHKPRSR